MPQMDPNNPLLRDIRGLDPVSIWPIAPGWWLLLAGAVVAIVLVLWWRRYQVHKDWRADAYARLHDLRARRRRVESRVLLGELSELLRRIAIARFGRRAAAGLSGQAWLMWLKAHDPRGFDWTVEGRMLIEGPYAPPGRSFDPAKIAQVIDAVRDWIGGEPGEDGLDAFYARNASRRWWRLRPRDLEV
jgi:hypothetical protein